MAFCNVCGQQVAEGTAVCPNCGNQLIAPTGAPMQGAKDFIGTVLKSDDHTAAYNPADIKNGTLMAVLAYLGWLLLIPLFVEKKNAFVRFHVNQGLILAILGTAYSFVSWVITTLLGLIWGVLATIAGVLLGIGSLVLFVAMVIGIINAATGKAKELPYVGQYRILN